MKGGKFMNKELWQECIDFHGHECPGLAIGFRASEIAREELGVEYSPDEEIVCITENDACGVDAVQYVTGCTMGKGNLIMKATGKMAFTFVSRKTGQAVRLYLNQTDRDMDREERKNHILFGPREEVFKIEDVDIILPEKARIFETIVCDKCGEGAPDHKIRLEAGKKLCLDCVSEYSRGW